jgi:hypothetical protein
MKYVLFIPFLLAIASCNTAGKTGNDNKAKLELLAERSCRAKAISEHRYALADSIRFAQDTLNSAKTKADSDRLQARLKLCFAHKAIVLKQSVALADSIRKQLDSLAHYGDRAAEKRFTKSFDSLMAKRGCK